MNINNWGKITFFCSHFSFFLFLFSLLQYKTAVKQLTTKKKKIILDNFLTLFISCSLLFSYFLKKERRENHTNRLSVVWMNIETRKKKLQIKRACKSVKKFFLIESNDEFWMRVDAMNKWMEDAFWESANNAQTCIYMRIFLFFMSRDE